MNLAQDGDKSNSSIWHNYQKRELYEILYTHVSYIKTSWNIIAGLLLSAISSIDKYYP